MADLYDQAADVEQFQRDTALAAQRRTHNAQSDGAGSDECVNCGDTIPAARRAAVPNAARCVDCQAQKERHVC
jgi:phage/conjugal plasmid C-4 type zinc finger TraR family protein